MAPSGESGNSSRLKLNSLFSGLGVSFKFKGFFCSGNFSDPPFINVIFFIFFPLVPFNKNLTGSTRNNLNQLGGVYPDLFDMKANKTIDLLELYTEV